MDAAGPHGDDPLPTMSKTKRKQTIWPDPLVLDPTVAHTHSIILLHGRGSNAERFGVELVTAKSSAGKTLREHFPFAKFIFPTAKKRRSIAFKRIPINQWFDNFSLKDPSRREDVQYDGIKETSEFVAGLVRREADAVGMEHVVIGGLSQGCAAALHILLNLGEPVPLAAFVGMSGWLPFAETLDPAAVKDNIGDEDDFFSTDDGDDEDASHLQEVHRTATNTARDIASLPPLSVAQQVVFPNTPIFLGHGKSDEKVSIDLGVQAKRVLEALGCSVVWKDYDEGHWYKIPEEIDDIVEFLQDIVKI